MRRSFFRTSRPLAIFRTMEDTQWSRKLDGQGRIMLPIRLREELGLEPGEEYKFYLHESEGYKYLCIRCPKDVENSLAEARRFLEEHGFIVSKRTKEEPLDGSEE